jgi:hypothetical protein
VERIFEGGAMERHGVSVGDELVYVNFLNVAACSGAHGLTQIEHILEYGPLPTFLTFKRTSRIPAGVFSVSFDGYPGFALEKQPILRRTRDTLSGEGTRTTHATDFVASQDETKPERAKMGASLEVAEPLTEPVAWGLRVSLVFRGGIAHRLGVRVGDKIVAVERWRPSGPKHSAVLHRIVVRDGDPAAAHKVVQILREMTPAESAKAYDGAVRPEYTATFYFKGPMEPQERIRRAHQEAAEDHRKFNRMMQRQKGKKVEATDAGDAKESRAGTEVEASSDEGARFAVWFEGSLGCIFRSRMTAELEASVMGVNTPSTLPVVDAVLPHSEAALAGVRPGDFVTAVNQEPLEPGTSEADLMQLLRNASIEALETGSKTVVTFLQSPEMLRLHAGSQVQVFVRLATTKSIDPVDSAEERCYSPQWHCGIIVATPSKEGRTALWHVLVDGRTEPVKARRQQIRALPAGYGAATRDELTAARKRAHLSCVAAEEQRVRAAFEALDADGSGELDDTEVLQIWKKLVEPVEGSCASKSAMEQAMGELKALDLSSEQVTLEGFTKWWRRRHPERFVEATPTKGGDQKETIGTSTLPSARGLSAETAADRYAKGDRIEVRAAADSSGVDPRDPELAPPGGWAEWTPATVLRSRLDNSGRALLTIAHMNGGVEIGVSTDRVRRATYTRDQAEHEAQAERLRSLRRQFRNVSGMVHETMGMDWLKDEAEREASTGTRQEADDSLPTDLV